MKHPVYHTLNMRPMIGPADATAFYFALCSACMVAMVLNSMVGAVVLFSAMYAIAVVLGQKDPRWLHFCWHACAAKTYYDPAK